MIEDRARVYVLNESDVWAIESVLAGLRTALNAIVVSRTIDPNAKPRRPREVRRFDQIVDEILGERDHDMVPHPDLF